MNPIELGNRIQSRRLTLGLTQQSLAEIAGLSVHGLSNIESGKGNPTLGVMNRLAEALGLNLSLDIRRPGELGTDAPKDMGD